MDSFSSISSSPSLTNLQRVGFGVIAATAVGAIALAILAITNPGHVLSALSSHTRSIVAISAGSAGLVALASMITALIKHKRKKPNPESTYTFSPFHIPQPPLRAQRRTPAREKHVNTLTNKHALSPPLGTKGGDSSHQIHTTQAVSSGIANKVASLQNSMKNPKINALTTPHHQ